MRHGSPVVRRWGAALGLALAGSLVLAGCGGGGSNGSSPSGSAGGAHAGGTLTFDGSANPACLDPHQLSEGLSLNVDRQIVDSLTDQDPDTGKIVPWLAKSWDINSDSTEFTFHLRDDVTFSDGTNLDADAVKANFDDIVNLGAKSLLGATYLSGYDHSTVTDPDTIQVFFKKPSAQFLQATATITLGILAPSTLAESAADRCEGKLVGSGPFTLQSFTNNQSITLAKRTGYDWSSPLAKHTGDAYLDKIVFQIVPDAGVRSGRLKAGQTDGIMDVAAQDDASFQSGDFWILSRANPGIVTSLIPNEDGILADAQIRKAIQIGINRDEIVSTLYSPEYQVASSILSSTTPDYVDLSSDLAYNPDQAKQLLDADGWKAGPDGIRTKDGQKLTVRALGAGPAGELLQQQLKAIGIDVDLLEANTSQQYLAIQSSGAYDLAGYNLTRGDPDVLTAIFSSKFTNVPHLKAGPLDDALEQVSSESDDTKRAAAAGTAQKLIVEDPDAFPINEQEQVFAFSSKVHDVVFEASTRMRLYDAWIS